MKDKLEWLITLACHTAVHLCAACWKGTKLAAVIFPTAATVDRVSDVMIADMAQH